MYLFKFWKTNNSHQQDQCNFHHHSFTTDIQKIIFYVVSPGSDTDLILIGSTFIYLPASYQQYKVELTILGILWQQRSCLYGIFLLQS